MIRRRKLRTISLMALPATVLSLGLYTAPLAASSPPAPQADTADANPATTASSLPAALSAEQLAEAAARMLAEARYEAALEQLQLLARLQPRSVDTHLNLARTLLILGRIEEAADAYRAVRRLVPQHPEAERFLARAALTTDQFQARLNGADHLIALGRHAEAQQLLQQTISPVRTPQEIIQVRLLLAQSHLLAHQPEPVLRLMRELDPADPTPMQRRQAAMLTGLALLLTEPTQPSVAQTARSLFDPFDPEPGFAIDREQQPHLHRLSLRFRTLLQLHDDLGDQDLATAIRSLVGQAMEHPIDQSVLKQLSDHLSASLSRRLQQRDWEAVVNLSRAVMPEVAPGDDLRILRQTNRESTRVLHRLLIDHLRQAAALELRQHGPEYRALALRTAFALTPRTPAGKPDFNIALGLLEEHAAFLNSHILRSLQDDHQAAENARWQLGAISALWQEWPEPAHAERLRKLILQRITTRLHSSPDIQAARAAEGFFRIEPQADQADQLIFLPAMGHDPVPTAIQIASLLADHGNRRAEQLAAQGRALPSGQWPDGYREAALLLRESITGHTIPAEARALIWQMIDQCLARRDTAGALAVLELIDADAPQAHAISRQIELRFRLLSMVERQLADRNLALPDDLNEHALNIIRLAVMQTAEGDAGSLQIADHWLRRLVGRYVEAGRPDLARVVIDRVEVDLQPGADPAQPLLAGSIPLRLRAELALEIGRRHWAAHLRSVDDPAVLGLMAQDAEAIEWFNQLMSRYGTTPLVVEIEASIRQIADRYAGEQAGNTAAGIFTTLIERHPAHSGRDRWYLNRAAIHIRQGHHQLRQQTEAGPAEAPAPAPDARIADAHAIAVEQLKAFAQQFPDSQRFTEARDMLATLALHYAELERWAAVRPLLETLARLAGEPESPLPVQFQVAVTHLGTLDPAYALTTLRNLIFVDQLMEAGGQAGRAVGWADDEYGYAQGQAPGLGLASREARPEDSAESFSSRRDSGVVADQALGVDFDGRTNLPGSRAVPSPVVPTPGDRQLAMLRQQESRMLARQQLAAQQNAEQRIDRQAVMPRAALDQEAQRREWIDAATTAVGLLLEITQADRLVDQSLVDPARRQLLWTVGFFERQQMFDHASLMLDRWIAEDAANPAKPALTIRSFGNQLTWAGRPMERAEPNLAALQSRQALFADLRQRLGAWITDNADIAGQKEYVRQARMMQIQAMVSQANLAEPIIPGRAAGLRMEAALAWLDLPAKDPDHPQAAVASHQAVGLAEQIAQSGRLETAVDLYGRIVASMPTDPVALRSLRRIAELQSQHLAAPLKAVETFQEFYALTGEDVATEIDQIARRLHQAQRYLEALHVYGVFVDSFPHDQRTPEALLATGRIHMANESWTDGIKAFQRLLDEYQQAAVIPDARAAMADCRIHLSQWTAARVLYERFLEEHPNHRTASTAAARIEVLKHLDRFQRLLDDPTVRRNRDEAQFQIARICQERLNMPLKAVEEYRKVVADFPAGAWADDAQLEIGILLLTTLNRREEGREALLAVTRYENSPLAGRALFILAESFEQEALALAGGELRADEDRLAEANRAAYRMQRARNVEMLEEQAARGRVLRQAGELDKLAIQETYGNFRFNALDNSINQFARIAEIEAERKSVLELANLQDRINEAYRQAAAIYLRAAIDYPLAERAAESLLRAARIQESKLREPDAAVSTYQRIVRFFPASPAAEDAAWKVADSLDRKGKHAAAVDAYREFIRKYPAGRFVAEAQFNLAESLEQMGRWVEAMDAYETFRQRFEDHPKAPLALEQINWIKAYRR